MGPLVDADMDAYNRSSGLPHNTVIIRVCEEAGLGPAECVPQPGWAGRAGLGWAGLAWAGLGWAGLGWARLGWVGLLPRI